MFHGWNSASSPAHLIKPTLHRYLPPATSLKAAFEARTSIDRRDFGLTWNQALETGGVLVGDKVEIALEIQAVQAQSAQKAA